MLKYKINFISICIILASAFILSNKCCFAQLAPIPISPETDAAAITAPKQDTVLDNLIKESIKEEDQKTEDKEKIDDPNIKPISNIKPEKPVEGKIESIITPTIFVKHILVEGGDLLTDEDISNITSEYENKNLTLSEIKEVVNKINNLYYDFGVLTSLAYLPPQEVQDNIVIIKVIEGKLGKLQVKDNKHTRAGYIKGAIQQKEGDIIYLPEIQKDILSFNRMNDVKLKARVRKGEEFGTSDITLEVEERNPYHLGFNFDNTGRDTVGVLKGGVNVQHDSVLGFRDRLTASYGRARSTNTVSTSYSLPVGHSGLRVGGAFGYGGIGISKGVLKDLNIEGKSFSYSGFASMPMVNTKRFTLGTSASFNAKKITTYLDGQSFSEVLGIPSTQIRTVVFSLNAVERDKYGQWMHNSDFHTGLELFGGKEKFYKYTGSLIRLQRLGQKSLLILKAATQFADDELPSAEQYGIGGAYSVRGYSEGILSGDNGYLFGGELRVPIFLLPEKIGNLKIRDNIQGVAFAETAGAFPEDYVRSSQTLTSVGLGIRANLTKYLTGRVDYGFGLAANREDDQPLARLHFSIESSPF
ncbi:MAG: hypothetical protein A2287_06470 [Candidatus Melainabacteria bacterium RIFOXYA12_FULL_32_12]|nr:MAG: hypothetical protein A2255_06950 [Candidatus Melainabacteria bacterium RIFOXYA2_FULL_32_9]OGI31592.1 MAG: hypothetical protein A2287_06470 [Candidatus Melainabacteria bacterium RIFOXYA12_FULL_32_12]